MDITNSNTVIDVDNNGHCQDLQIEKFINKIKKKKKWSYNNNG